MLDKILAILSVGTLATFVAIILFFVREIDLIIICVVVVLMAAFDFYLAAFRRNKQDEDS